MKHCRRTLPIGLLTTSVVALTIGISGSPAFAGTSIYNAVAKFSPSANPHSNWSYRATGALLGTKSKHACGAKKLNGWWNNGQEPSGASIVANKTAALLACATNSTVRVPAETINMDPESVANVSVQFTATKAGTYSVTGAFLGDDTGEIGHTVKVLHNGTALYTNTISAYGQKDAFNLSATVHPGDTISFVVETSVWHNLSTGLQATLTS